MCACPTAEREALDRLEEQDRTCRRGAVVISENEAPRELFIVRSGWLHSSVVLGNGSRQIMRFHFQGDILGLPLLAFADSPETVTAVTDVTLCPFSRERLAGLIADHPRLRRADPRPRRRRPGVARRPAGLDRPHLGPRPGRRSLLCEIFARHAPARRAATTTAIQLPLTQEEIGDATGLTAVHVNRMMRGLVEDGIIERTGSQIRLLDEKRLIAEANFVDRTGIETGWLPPPR